MGYAEWRYMNRISSMNDDQLIEKFHTGDESFCEWVAFYLFFEFKKFKKFIYKGCKKCKFCEECNGRTLFDFYGQTKKQRLFLISQNLLITASIFL
jgi:MoaA/NifB/PqqE/SkfB family radical SAM enzyme